MDKPSKAQRMELALLRQRGGIMVIEKSNARKRGLHLALQELASTGSGVTVIRDTAALVIYQVAPRHPLSPPET